ncbi:di-heme oxidoreductase family protein [Archangium lipolyticum]|uniref:di-heme oxidoreductase family protein n=1 Tax=Archangium lipolyticum TaxID=2970465 RepID=UPI002149B471|nr:di-heme oxidoredictase family protein [Archangium lipolyticum]
MRRQGWTWAVVFALSAVACREEPPSPAPPGEEPPVRWDVVEPGEALSGGEAGTVTDASARAFSQSLPALTLERRSGFVSGRGVFEIDWIPAPASSSRADRDGLGPLFHAVACMSCHVGNGRTAPPDEPGSTGEGLLIRLSIPGTASNGGPLPEPTYGDQLQPKGVPGVPAEARVVVRHSQLSGTFADGEPFTLLAPEYALEELAHGPPHPDTMLSPRLAQPLHGLGLLAAVPEETVLEWADPDDVNGDGISGRPNRVWSVRRGTQVLGRFGWKANQPDLEQQSAGAFLGDMGLTTPLFPSQPCTPAEQACGDAPSGGAPEVEANRLAALTFYSHAIAVPARRDVDSPEVLRGKALFHRVGCAGCHRPTLTTGPLEEYPELSGQKIRPYTDLLLHDLGEGLADGRPDFEATGREWRTAPLWGIGLTATVNGHTRFLHDGRARSLMEAILWHGGEAEVSREAVKRLSKEERESLLKFLESL